MSPMKTVVNMHMRKIIISNLREAKFEIDSIIERLENEQNYTLGSFGVDLEHAYHHMNFAWNIRGVSDVNAVIHLSHNNFIKWSKYPSSEIKEYG